MQVILPLRPRDNSYLNLPNQKPLRVPSPLLDRSTWLPAIRGKGRGVQYLASFHRLTSPPLALHVTVGAALLHPPPLRKGGIVTAPTNALINFLGNQLGGDGLRGIWVLKMYLGNKAQCLTGRPMGFKLIK